MATINYIMLDTDKKNSLYKINDNDILIKPQPAFIYIKLKNKEFNVYADYDRCLNNSSTTDICNKKTVRIPVLATASNKQVNDILMWSKFRGLVDKLVSQFKIKFKNGKFEYVWNQRILDELCEIVDDQITKNNCLTPYSISVFLKDIPLEELWPENTSLHTALKIAIGEISNIEEFSDGFAYGDIYNYLKKRKNNKANDEVDD